MQKKLFLCLLLLCSFIFIASASDPPSYELRPRDASDDQDDFMLAADPLIDDDEEDEEATSSLNHIDEDDAKDNVEEIDIWANAGDIDDDEPDDSEEDLVDDEDEDAEDDEHDHEHDDEEDDEVEDDEEEDNAIDHDSFDEPDEDPFEQDRVQFGLDPDTTQTEEEEELKWSNQFIPEEGRSPEQLPASPQQPTYNDDEKELEQGHANAELETKEQEASLMNLGVEDDADNDIPPPEHGSHHGSELEKENTLVQDWNASRDSAIKEPCHKRSTLVWLGLLACCLVLFYGARIRAKSDGLDGDSKHAILPVCKPSFFIGKEKNYSSMILTWILT